MSEAEGTMPELSDIGLYGLAVSTCTPLLLQNLSLASFCLLT